MRSDRAPVGRPTAVRRLTVALAVLTALSLSTVACKDSTKDAATTPGGSSTTDAKSLLGTPHKATGSPVKIGVISDGATQAYDNTSEFVAAKAAADYWNEYQGGIAGHTVETVTCQAKGDPAGATDCANKMIADGVVAVVVGQSSVSDSIWKPLHQAKVPLMFLAASGEGPLTDPDTTFNLHNGYATLFALPVSVAKQKDAKKVAFVVINVPQALEAFDAAAPKMLESAGLQYDLVKVDIGTADMTPQMQQVANSGAGVVQVVGNDSFCIAAFQGLKAVGYSGEITSISQCVTDATRKAVDPSTLEGMYLTATVAVGDTTDEGYQRYVAIMDKYASGTNPDNSITMGAYTSMASLLTGLAKLTGDVTPATVTSTMKSMDKSLVPGGAGMEYQCNGKANPATPAVCSSQVLQVQLDAKGNPATYSVGTPAT